MARRRYAKSRCKAKLATGKTCTKIAVSGGACGIPAHQRQLTSATLTRARKRRRASKPNQAAPRTLAKQAKFLNAYRTIGVITMAAEAAGIDRKRHYEWLEQTERYPKYKVEFDHAHEAATDRLEAEAIRRGLDGWDEPKYGTLPGVAAGTGEVGVIHRFSDRLLELVLKARRSHFRDRPVQVGVGVHGIAQRVEIIIPDNGLRRDSQRAIE